MAPHWKASLREVRLPTTFITTITTELLPT
jgi:hypothetical protein